MADAAAYGKGMYVLTTWATVAEVSAPDVRSKFKAKYGEAEVESLGRKSTGVNFGVLSEKFREALDDGAPVMPPEPAWLNSALLAAGGATPSASQLAAAVAGDSLQAASDVAKVGLTLAAGGVLFTVIAASAVVWMLYKSGALKELAKNVRMPGV